MRLSCFLIIVAFPLLSCSNVNEEKERTQILELHNLQQKYHFEKMADAFVSLMAEDYISVNRGVIKYPTKEENTKRFDNYFNSVEFEKWEDLSPPIIRFSEDYTMAYTVVHKLVVVNYENENQEWDKGETEFSWVAIYKKQGGEWKIDCVVSTEKAGI